MREFGIGQSIPRTEDRRLIQGKGRFVDDFCPAPASPYGGGPLTACGRPDRRHQHRGRKPGTRCGRHSAWQGCRQGRDRHAAHDSPAAQAGWQPDGTAALPYSRHRCGALCRRSGGPPSSPRRCTRRRMPPRPWRLSTSRLRRSPMRGWRCSRERLRSGPITHPTMSRSCSGSAMKRLWIRQSPVRITSPHWIIGSAAFRPTPWSHGPPSAAMIRSMSSTR